MGYNHRLSLTQRSFAYENFQNTSKIQNVSEQRPGYLRPDLYSTV